MIPVNTSKYIYVQYIPFFQYIQILLNMFKYMQYIPYIPMLTNTCLYMPIHTTIHARYIRAAPRSRGIAQAVTLTSKDIAVQWVSDCRWGRSPGSWSLQVKLHCGSLSECELRRKNLVWLGDQVSESSSEGSRFVTRKFQVHQLGQYQWAGRRPHQLERSAATGSLLPLHH